MSSSSPETPVITYSDIARFLTCRRAWTWDYLMDVRPKESLIGAMAAGSRVHRAVERYYLSGEDPLPFYEDMVAADLASIEGDDPKPWELEQFYKDVIMGRNCVSAFMAWLTETGADDPYEIEAVERTIETPFLGGRVILRGKVDVLKRRKDSGFLVVDDTKTDGSWTSIREKLERSWQHHVYLIIARLLFPDEHVTECHYTVLRKVMKPSRVTTRPLVERFRVAGTTRTAKAKEAQLEAIVTDMLRSWRDISVKGLDHAYPSPGDQCRWCDYKHPCLVQDESPEAAVELLAREFRHGGRHDRYL